MGHSDSPRIRTWVIQITASSADRTDWISSRNQKFSNFVTDCHTFVDLIRSVLCTFPCKFRALYKLFRNEWLSVTSELYNDCQ